MASNVIFKATLLASLFLPLLSHLAIADEFKADPIPSYTICNITTDPSYCRHVLPKQDAKVHDFGRFSIKKSLFQAQNLSNFTKSYLLDHSTLSQGTVRAIQDCIFLSELNVDYLSKSNEIVMNAPETLSSSQVDYAHSLLSAILTNHQTCLSGLMSMTSNMSTNFEQLSDDTKLHSLSLALFTNGWVHEKKNMPKWNPKGWHPGFRNGRLPLKMSNRTRAIYNNSSRGKRQHEDDENEQEGVLISGMVVVSQDGSGNFTTINDAVNAAPTNNNVSDGYFLIYINEGVYEEYVSIPINKPFLMMVGDGINRTIITGNHSAGDGWTTFNSPTFGKKIRALSYITLPK